MLFFCALLTPVTLFAETPPINTQFERMAQIDQFVWEGLPFLPKKTASKLRQLGHIVRDVSNTETNAYFGDAITYKTITFSNGLEVYFRTFGSPPELQYIRITVTSSRWPVKDGLIVGSPRARILEKLGLPSEEGDGWISYSGETEQVTFALKSKRVSKIIFDFYTD